MSGLGSGTRGFHPLSSADDSVLALEKVVVAYAERGVSVGGKDEFRAVDGVTLAVRSGRSVGLVGESGCGKSSLGRSILGLAPLTSGEISIGEREATSARRRGHVRRRLSRSVQIVFQDPYSSLDPRQSVAGIVAEPMVVHRIGTPADRRDRVAHLLEQVGLPSSFGDRYPHELSGGQRQRVCIARALSVEPVLLVCDEPTSALDVSIQAQVVELLQGLAEDRDLTYLFITHDLALLPQLTEEVAVMYLGRLVETGPESEVLRRPRHPYTVSLLAAAPVLGHRREKAIERIASGDLGAGTPDRGCPFRSRCWLYRELDGSDAAACEEQAPGLDVVPGDSGRRTACHHHHALSAVEVEVAAQRPDDESAIDLPGAVRGQNGP